MPAHQPTHQTGLQRKPRTMKKSPSPARIVALALSMGILAPSFLGSGHLQAQQNLPNMGEPADNALSPIEERQLGAQFMREIRTQLPLVRDIPVTEYIQTLGNRLALASGKRSSSDFTFFVINDPQINAFAIPGGYVGVNVGLALAMDIEEQLASVVAHEVAHVTQRHHARAFALSNQYSVRTAATIFAALLIGQASPQAGQAALAAGMAANQHNAVNFTRTNEIEADRIGIEILTNAQYDPSAMAESFAILRRENRLNTSRDALQYLRTHPLDNNRIAEAKDRANSKPSRSLAPQIDFQLFKARLAVLSTDDKGQLLRTYQAKFNASPTPETTYGIALLHAEANRLDQAIEYLDEFDQFSGTHPLVQLSRAQVLERKGDLDASMAILESLHQNYPERFSVVEKLVDLQVRKRQISNAKRISKQYIRRAPNPNPLAWRQLAQLQQRVGEQAESHESLAKYFTGINELGRAQNQLKLALQHVAPASNDELRLKASLKSLRGIPPGTRDEPDQ